MKIFLGCTVCLTIKSLLNQFFAINVFLMNFAFLMAGPDTTCLFCLLPLAPSPASLLEANGRGGCRSQMPGPPQFLFLSPSSISPRPFPQPPSLGSLMVCFGSNWNDVNAPLTKFVRRNLTTQQGSPLLSILSWTRKEGVDKRCWGNGEDVSAFCPHSHPPEPPTPSQSTQLVLD